MFGSLILVFALCTDTFVASLAYDANRIHVTWGRVALLNGICNGCLGLALGVGSLIDTLISEDLTKIICFVYLFVLGFVRLLDYDIEAFINHGYHIRRNLSFNLSGLKVIVSTYGDPMAVDVDRSLSLGWRETVFLALAMSVDNLVAGTMATFLNLPTGATLGLFFVVGVCMMYAGLWLDGKVASKWKYDLSWISGVLFMILVLMKVL